MSACIIRTLLYEHSGIDAIPELIVKGGSRREQQQGNGGDTQPAFGSSGTTQPDWESISKDLSLADPDQVMACDVYIFRTIAKRMPQEQLMALLRGAREQALATKDEAKFRQLASVMPASSLLILLQEISDTVQKDRQVQGLSADDNEDEIDEDEEDNEDNDDTTNHSEDSTINSNQNEHDESWDVNPDPTTTYKDKVASVLPSQLKLSSKLSKNRHVSFNETNDVCSIEPLEKSPELWWEKDDMREIRGQCSALVEQYAYAENDWEYIETLSRILNDPETISAQLTADLKILAQHDVCRGLERHINDELHDLCHMHCMNVLHSQNDLRQETGSTNPLAYWDTLAEAASETSLLSELFAVKLAYFDRTQIDARPVLVD